MRNNNSLISVIVPVYNVDKYLDGCIESIVNQTYKNLEIILVDDGSTDNSPKLCDAWEKKDKRVKVIHKKNGGVSSARNVGIEHASGEYISFVDSDDFLNKDMFKIMINKIKKTNTDLCYCDIYRIELDGSISVTNFNSKFYLTSEEMMKLMFKNRCANFAVWNKLFKTSYVKKISFEESIYVKEDALFVFQYLDLISSVSYINIPLYNYVQQELSVLHSNSLSKYVTSLDAMMKIIEILKKKKIDEYIHEECNFIGNYFKIRKRLNVEKINLDVSRFDKVINNYLDDGLLQKAKLKDKVKILYYLRKKV